MLGNTHMCRSHGRDHRSGMDCSGHGYGCHHLQVHAIENTDCVSWLSRASIDATGLCRLARLHSYGACNLKIKTGKFA